MKVIWIVADTFRRDHVGAYGNPQIRTPSLDALAERSIRFDRHYAAAFPTMPTRADHFSGRWTMSFMSWGPLGSEVRTLAQLLSDQGIHTAAVADTPFYLRHGMNYDRGFQTFHPILGQEGSATRLMTSRHHESRDVRDWWRLEIDRNAPQTMIRAADWLERHYQEDFFLYVDTWDPHEPWDAPIYYTELYWPDYDGEVIQPVYGRWQQAPGFSQDRVAKAHATYQGEVTMVDAWVGHLLRKIESLGIAERTAIVFTSDHGFYFGEHGGYFGKMAYATSPDGHLYDHSERGAIWTHSPLYEEVTALPLLMKIPGLQPGRHAGLTSAVDVMPTVLDLMEQEIPDWVEGRSLLSSLNGSGAGAGRDFVVTTIPFANPGDVVSSVDNVDRLLDTFTCATVSTAEWTLLFRPEPGRSELYHLPSDPAQAHNVIQDHHQVAKDIHQLLLRFMRETDVPDRLLEPRRELRL